MFLKKKGTKKNLTTVLPPPPPPLPSGFPFPPPFPSPPPSAGFGKVAGQAAATVASGSIPSDIPEEKLLLLGKGTTQALLGLIDSSPTCMERISQIHKAVSSTIQDLCRAHRAKLYTFGSSVVYGFVEPESDIDFVFLTEKDLSREANDMGDSASSQARSDQNFVLGLMAKVLKQKGAKEFQSVIEMPRARVPFVRCVMKNGQEVDISANRRNGVRNSLLLNSYFMQPSFSSLGRWLALSVKVWAKRSSLIDPQQAYLTSYAMNILVIYFLIQRKKIEWINPASVEIPRKEPVLPVYSPLVFPPTDESHRELGFHMRDFLRFYNQEFDYAQHVVTLSRKGLTTKQDLDWTLSCEEKSRAMGGSFWYRLCLEDPYEERLNLGRFVTPMKFDMFRSAMTNAVGNGLGYF